MKWEDFPNFSQSEFTCPCCGEAKIERDLVAKLQKLRTLLGFSLPIVSGYRCPKYNDSLYGSQGKRLKGPHTTGRAADVAVSGVHARLFLEASVEEFDGIGVKQHGDGRFIHVDYGLGFRLWTYD